MEQNYFETAQLPLFAADFDYFRVPREKWEFMLSRLKQMGVNGLSLSVPWGFHEFKQGSVDLNGVTNIRRDVVGLLALCSALELPCLLKIGPYCNLGLLNDGLPSWLSSKEAEDFETILSQGVSGWYKAVSKALVDRQWPAGPIIALYVSGEPATQQEPILSKQLTEVKWRIWLRKHYEGIEALNAAYGTDYRTVNDVKFPHSWAHENTPLARDAKDFLAKVRIDTETHYTQTLTDAGWQLPIYPSVQELHPELPSIQAHSLSEPDGLPLLTPSEKILNLQQPIQVDPEPVEVGQAPTWAECAPIRVDGSVRQSFWTARQQLWSLTLVGAKQTNKTLTTAFDSVTLLTATEATSVKIEVGAGQKPTVFRLRLNGELVDEDQLKVRQGKLSGPYLAEDETDQTDLILILGEPVTPLVNYPLAYLRNLLIAQLQTLSRCTTLSENLGKILTSSPSPPESAPAERPHLTVNTIEEARRGLREADAALRKAISSISGLENGFATVLDKTTASLTPQPASASVPITPEIFEASVQDVLLGIGTTCQEIFPHLNAAATNLQNLIDTPEGGFTVTQYRQGYQTAVAAAMAARQPLLKIITQLRQQIGSEKLPFVIWHIHDQVQEITETLRWGVLRS